MLQSAKKLCFYSMLIQFSGIGIVAGSGKLNGTVMAKNKGGAYARVKITPVNPQTTAQQNTRNILSTWSQGWRGLTQTQRDGWNTAAASFPYVDRFGNSRQLSGQQLYVKLNSNLNYANAAGIDDAPAPVEIPALTTVSVTADESTAAVTLTFAPTPVPADFALIVRAAGNVGQGKTFVKNLYRNVSVLDAAATSPAVISADYAAKFGPPIAGLKTFVQIFLISTTTGQAGIPLQADTINVP